MSEVSNVDNLRSQIKNRSRLSLNTVEKNRLLRAFRSDPAGADREKTDSEKIIILKKPINEKDTVADPEDPEIIIDNVSNQIAPIRAGVYDLVNKIDINIDVSKPNSKSTIFLRKIGNKNVSDNEKEMVLNEIGNDRVIPEEYLKFIDPEFVVKNIVNVKGVSIKMPQFIKSSHTKYLLLKQGNQRYYVYRSIAPDNKYDMYEHPANTIRSHAISLMAKYLMKAKINDFERGIIQTKIQNENVDSSALTKYVLEKILLYRFGIDTVSKCTATRPGGFPLYIPGSVVSILGRDTLATPIKNSIAFEELKDVFYFHYSKKLKKIDEIKTKLILEKKKRDDLKRKRTAATESNVRDGLQEQIIGVKKKIKQLKETKKRLEKDKLLALEYGTLISDKKRKMESLQKNLKKEKNDKKKQQLENNIKKLADEIKSIKPAVHMISQITNMSNRTTRHITLRSFEDHSKTVDNIFRIISNRYSIHNAIFKKFMTDNDSDVEMLKQKALCNNLEVTEAVDTTIRQFIENSFPMYVNKLTEYEVRYMISTIPLEYIIGSSDKEDAAINTAVPNRITREYVDAVKRKLKSDFTILDNDNSNSVINDMNSIKGIDANIVRSIIGTDEYTRESIDVQALFKFNDVNGKHKVIYPKKFAEELGKAIKDGGMTAYELAQRSNVLSEMSIKAWLNGTAIRAPSSDEIKEMSNKLRKNLPAGSGKDVNVSGDKVTDNGKFVGYIDAQGEIITKRKNNENMLLTFVSYLRLYVYLKNRSEFTYSLRLSDENSMEDVIENSTQINELLAKYGKNNINNIDPKNVKKFKNGTFISSKVNDNVTSKCKNNNSNRVLNKKSQSLAKRGREMLKKLVYIFHFHRMMTENYKYPNNIERGDMGGLMRGMVEQYKKYHEDYFTDRTIIEKERLKNLLTLLGKRITVYSDSLKSIVQYVPQMAYLRKTEARGHAALRARETEKSKPLRKAGTRSESIKKMLLQYKNKSNKRGDVGKLNKLFNTLSISDIEKYNNLSESQQKRVNDIYFKMKNIESEIRQKTRLRKIISKLYKNGANVAFTKENGVLKLKNKFDNDVKSYLGFPVGNNTKPINILRKRVALGGMVFNSERDANIHEKQRKSI